MTLMATSGVESVRAVATGRSCSPTARPASGLRPSDATVARCRVRRDRDPPTILYRPTGPASTRARSSRRPRAPALTPVPASSFSATGPRRISGPSNPSSPATPSASGRSGTSPTSSRTGTPRARARYGWPRATCACSRRPTRPSSARTASATAVFAGLTGHRVAGPPPRLQRPLDEPLRRRRAADLSPDPAPRARGHCSGCATSWCGAHDTRHADLAHRGVVAGLEGQGQADRTSQRHRPRGHGAATRPPYRCWRRNPHAASGWTTSTGTRGPAATARPRATSTTAGWSAAGAEFKPQPALAPSGAAPALRGLREESNGACR